MQSTGRKTLASFEQLQRLAIPHHTWAFTFPMKLREVCYGRCFSIAAVLLAVLFSGTDSLGPLAKNNGLGPSAKDDGDMDVIRK